MTQKKKPKVYITRRLPEAVETRMRELFDAELNIDDTPRSQPELVAAVKSAEAGDFKAAESTYEKLGLDHWTVSRAQVAAFYWACRINVEKSHDD